LLENIIEKLNPNIFILKEFTPPDNLFSEDLKNVDQFFITYHMIHELTTQKTFKIDNWKEIFLNL
jgi:hypothetical protein